MKAVFLDTVGLLAIWDSTDQWHAAASVAFQLLDSQKRPVVSTPEVLLECANAAARKPFRGQVPILRQLLIDEGMLIEPTSDEVHAAWREYGQSSQGQPGIVDLLSFTVMKRLGLTDVFTNDRHFVAAGFRRLF